MCGQQEQVGLVHVWETMVDPWSVNLALLGSWLERHLGADVTAP